MNYTSQYLREAVEILTRLDHESIDQTLGLLMQVRKQGGRIFFLGAGGGAAHASHAVNDFRKIAGIECYAPTDNVSELTARINDDGWESSYRNWLVGSHLGQKDCVFVFSVGGGNVEHKISMNLVTALQYAKDAGAKVCGIVGRDGGFTAQVAEACVVIPVVNVKNITAHTESFQALISHLLVSHPKLKSVEMKWESEISAIADSVRCG
jgi:D-sedoheptulose 7-phosphate isomerase